MDTVEKLEDVKEKKQTIKKNSADTKSKKAVKNNAEASNSAVTSTSSLKEKRAKLIVGAFLLLFSTYLFVALVSFFFTWSVDQDKVVDGYWNLLANNEIKVSASH